MALLLAIILIILGLLVFALRGFFGAFPDSWEWTGIVIAGVGLAMSVPSVFQMTIGHPKLILDYDRIIRNQERSLAIFLKNEPLKAKSLWPKIGVRRETIQSLTVAFRISEVGTGNIVIPIMQARLYSYDDISNVGNWRIALPPTLSFEATMMVAMWNDAKKKAIVPGDGVRSEVELSAGIYKIVVIFAIEGIERNEFGQFVVGNTADELIWVVSGRLKTGKKGLLN